MDYAQSEATGMPKRLLATLVCLSLLAVLGLIQGWLPMFNILLLLLVLGCLGKQKAGLMMLRLLGMTGLTLFITGPVIMLQLPDNPTGINPAIDAVMALPDSAVYALAAAGTLFSGLTLWVAFSDRVSRFFSSPMRFNILG
ncbi:hypothetical protein L2750_07300 [Shewanella submarina]|uniref:Energy-coupling factor transporter transmembrane protein EcfT n=1 Tax=Shewanella submarina TaxID=2016376 RepID=A0ABV7G8I8_9GAMM|nr:hypothetical protein [Shewanella submarina]MCL1036958.1 hypothetical protein [Shewanella submarina]